MQIYCVESCTTCADRLVQLQAGHFGVLSTHDQLADHTWNPQNPRWLRATLFAAQYAAWGWLQEKQTPDGLRRCAACAVNIPESQAKARCSKCKLVPLVCQSLFLAIFSVVQQQHVIPLQMHFCSRACQATAHPIHKNYCLQPALRQYAASLEVSFPQQCTQMPESCISLCTLSNNTDLMSKPAYWSQCDAATAR